MVNVKKKLKENLTAYAFIAAFLILYLVFNFYTLIQGFFVSLNDWRITNDMTFVGIKNYLDILQDSTFLLALCNTIKYVLISTPVYIVGAFLLAYIVESKLIRRKSFFRATFFLPNVLAVSIIAVIWRYMFQPYTGLINSTLHMLGIRGEPFWVTQESLVWPSIIIMTFWWNVGYYMILYMAGLQDIPEELYEASDLEGANLWQRLRYIVIPYLKPIHALVLFLQMIASFKIFGQVYLVTNGGPSGASRMLIQYIYETGFSKFDMGTASAAAFVLFIIVFLFSLPMFKALNSGNEER